MRQLYEACVAPVLDYASTVWHDLLRDKTPLRHLRTAQRTVPIRVLSSFRTVGTSTFDVQAPNSFEEELAQFTNDVTTTNDTNTTPELGLEDLDPESPKCQKLVTLKYNRTQAVPVTSSPPAITTDAPSVEDPTDDIWHETSERSDDEFMRQ